MRGQIEVVGLVIGIALVLIACWLALTVRFVSAGYVGIPTMWGAVQGYTVQPGLHFVAPLAGGMVGIEVRTQVYENEAESASKDLQVVHTTVALNFQIVADQADDIYNTVGLDYCNRIIKPAIQESVKAATALFDAEELITHRPLVKDAIKDALYDRLLPYGIYVETISITNFEFSADFNEAIEAKVVALQKKLQAEYDLQRIEVEAQQKAAKAQGEADAIRIIDEQLKKSPTYIDYLLADKWNGILPLATGGTVPFINIGE